MTVYRTIADAMEAAKAADRAERFAEVFRRRKLSTRVEKAEAEQEKAGDRRDT